MNEAFGNFIIFYVVFSTVCWDSLFYMIKTNKLFSPAEKASQHTKNELIKMFTQLVFGTCTMTIALKILTLIFIYPDNFPLWPNIMDFLVVFLAGNYVVLKANG